MTRGMIVLTTACLALAALGPGVRADDTTRPISDRQFAEKAAQGGMAEVKLGELARQRAVEAAVKKFGQRMIQDHSAANKELAALLKEKGWYPPSFTRDLMGPHKETYDALARRSGADFDRAYMLAMVDDHQLDVALFESMMKTGQDAQLRDFAAKTLPMLKEHLKLARQIAAQVNARTSRSGDQ